MSKHKGERNVIYLDMDGVLVDFDLHFEMLTGLHPRHFENNNDGFWKVFDKHHHTFFLDAPEYDYIDQWVRDIADLAFEHDYDIEILTALPRKSTVPLAADHKKEWTKNRSYILPYKVNFGPYAKDKQKWAKPEHVLIDDKALNIQQWNNAGGLGICHSPDRPWVTVRLLENALKYFKESKE